MRKQLLVISVSAALLLAACSGGGGGSPSGNDGGSSSPSGDTVMSGNVVNGPLSGATVEIFNTNGELVGSTFTDTNGFYEHSGLPSSANGYRVVASNGFLNGEPYPGDLIARCEASPCGVTPLTTAVEKLAEQEQVGYANAHQQLFDWLGLEEDPFVAAHQNRPVPGVDLNSVRAGLRGNPAGVTGWVAQLVEEVSRGGTPPENLKPVTDAGPEDTAPAPGPAPGPKPDPAPTDISPNAKNVTGYSAHPHDSSIVFASIGPDFIGDASPDIGNFISTDMGVTWTKLTDGWFSENISYSPHDPHILIADPYISEDTGQTWRKTNTVPTAFDFVDLSVFFDPNRSDVIYGVASTVLANPKLYQSSNLGLSWNPMSFTKDLIYLNYHEETSVGGVFRPSIYTSTLSTDLVGVIYDNKILITNNGDSLTSTEFGLPLNYTARSIHFDTNDVNIIRVLLASDEIYESVDAGLNWSLNSSLLFDDVTSGSSLYTWETNPALSNYTLQNGRLYLLP